MSNTTSAAATAEFETHFAVVWDRSGRFPAKVLRAAKGKMNVDLLLVAPVTLGKVVFGRQTYKTTGESKWVLASRVEGNFSRAEHALQLMDEQMAA